MRGSFEALNLFVEIPDLAERLGPRFPFDERARFLEDPDRLREVVPLQLQIEQLAPGFAHLLLYEIGDVSRDEADAGLSLRRSNLLDETLDSFADEVHEGDIEGTPGVRDQCDRALDVAPLPRLDGVVDDPLPLVDFESDPFRGDQEGFHLVHELRELSVEQLPVPGRNPALRLFSGLTEGG